MTSTRLPERRRIGSQTFAIRRALTPRQAVVLLAASLAAFLAAAAVAWDGTVPRWEAEIVRSINGWPDWLEPILWIPQQLGVLGAPVIGGLLIAWSTRRWQFALPFLLLVPIKLSIEWLFLKQIVERGRPYETVGPDINIRGTPVEGLAFPSGHATTAFAFAVLLVAFLPRPWRPLPIVLAMVVGLARLYAGAHNALDVVGGAAVGTIFGVVLWSVMLNRHAGEPERIEGS